MTRARLIIALLTCPLGHACAPQIYELAGERDSEDPNDSTGPTDPTSPTEPPGQPGPPTCDDGQHNGSETDLDCGGPCPPCDPGQRCQEPRDCQLGDCVDFTCAKPGCLGPEDCPPPGPCMLSTCSADGQCIPIPADDLPCDDGDPCTLKEQCLGGKCMPQSKLDCSDLDGPCRAGVCNPNSGGCTVEWLYEGEPCKDGCALLAQCTQGECLGKQPPGPLLATDFSLAGGWLAEPPWSIGPAEPSACSFEKADDPANDHSPGADDHVAGAVIGGCLPTDAFPEACLESPPIDLMFLPGELWLTYWSVLSTAGAPMQSRIDLRDGPGPWTPILTFDSFTAEPDWTEHTIDLTPYFLKGPVLRIRFCHASTGPGDPVGGWSIDDLRIGPPQCF